MKELSSQAVCASFSVLVLSEEGERLRDLNDFAVFVFRRAAVAFSVRLDSPLPITNAAVWVINATMLRTDDRIGE